MYPALTKALNAAALEAYVAAATSESKLESARLVALGDTLTAQAHSEDRTVVACGK